MSDAGKQRLARIEAMLGAAAEQPAQEGEVPPKGRTTSAGKSAA